jgi:hypothetical protein
VIQSRFVFAVVEALRAAAALPRAERARRALGPRAAAEAMRALGEARRRRSPAERARLQRAIRIVDRLAFRAGANCYRRALLEMALDAGAAGEPLMMGFKSGGGAGSGHAWLASHRDGGAFDLVVSA